MDLKVLESADLNNDGWITKSELVAALVKSGLSSEKAHKHTNDFFNIADRQNNGLVPVREFINEYIRMTNFKMVFFIERKMDTIDRNNDKMVNKDELLGVLTKFLGAEAAEANLNRIFSEMDADGSGGISFLELKKWYEATERKMRKAQREVFQQPRPKGNAFKVPEGYLTLILHEGVALPNRDIGKQDPYVIFQLGNERLRSRTHFKGGSEPRWQEEFTLKCDGTEDVLHIVAMDEDKLSDDVIGRADVAVTSLINGGAQQWYTLLDRDLNAGTCGKLMISCTYMPTANAASSALQEQEAKAKSSEAKRIRDEEEEKVTVREEAYDSDVENYQTFEREMNPLDIVNADELKGDASFGIKLTETKTRFLAIKPWKGQVFAPTNAPSNNPSMPAEGLELEWVYGYRAMDVRQNIAINTEGHVIYPCAAVVVKYNVQAHAQSFFQGHNDDIISLAANPANPDIIATGQIATIVERRAVLPHICVWNSRTNETWVMERAHKRAVRALGFSSSGKFLASVGMDDNQEVAVWDWQNQTKITSSDGEALPNKIYQVVWRNDSEFVTVGIKHIYFWTFTAGALSRVRGKLASAGPEFALQTFFSAAFNKAGALAVTTKEGPIYIFIAGAAKRKLEAHKGAVNAVFATSDGGFVSGGKDGKVVIFDSQFATKRSIGFSAPIRALYVTRDTLIVGTGHSEVFRVQNYQSGTQPVLLAKGHHDGELWGLDVDPNNAPYFATAGEDNKIFVWEGKSHRFLAVAQITDKTAPKRVRERAATMSSEPEIRCARAVSFSPDSKHLAVGTNEGELAVFELKTMQRIALHDLNSFSKQQVTNNHGTWIQAMKYSPNGKILAVATHGSVIVLCDVKNNYKPSGVLKAHNAAVTHLDWSEDSKFIQSNCRAYELLFHNINENKLSDSSHNPYSSQLKDVEWKSQTCILGWPVQGIFDPLMDGTDINCVDRSPDKKLLVVGDDFGNLNLYRYPVLAEGNSRRILIGHSSHVMGARFLADQSYVITAGGNDRAVMQWRVTYQGSY